MRNYLAIKKKQVWPLLQYGWILKTSQITKSHLLQDPIEKKCPE